MRIRLSLVFLAGVASAQALMFDTFDPAQGPFIGTGITLASGNRLVSGSIVGGSRGASLIHSGEDSFSRSLLNIDGTLNLSSDLGTATRVTLGYFTLAFTANGGAAYEPGTNFDLSGNDSWKFNFLENDRPITIRVRLLSDGQVVRERTYERTIQAGGARSIMLTPQDIVSEGAGFDISQVDLVRIHMESGSGSDYILDSIEAVPEPTTLLALGLGAAALARRRSRR